MINFSTSILVTPLWQMAFQAKWKYKSQIRDNMCNLLNWEGTKSCVFIVSKSLKADNPTIISRYNRNTGPIVATFKTVLVSLHLDLRLLYLQKKRDPVFFAI